MKHFILIPVVASLLLAMWADAAQGADHTETTRKLPNGSVEVCKYETDFVTTKDGATVVRTAWRCVTTKDGK